MLKADPYFRGRRGTQPLCAVRFDLLVLKKAGNLLPPHEVPCLMKRGEHVQGFSGFLLAQPTEF